MNVAQPVQGGMPAAVSRAAWYRQLLPRFSRLWWLKAIGTTAIMTLFFVGYFHVLRHPAYTPALVPLTVVDAWVPFYAPALVVYASLWFYVSLAPAMLLGWRELVAYGFWVTGLCVCGLLFFYFWPTMVTPQSFDRGQFWGFDVLQGVDAIGNACPSLHVASAAFSLYWFDRVLKDMNAGTAGRVVNVLWFAGIAYSTMATKQHVFIDVMSGFVLGSVFALGSLWRRELLSWADYQRAPARSAAG